MPKRNRHSQYRPTTEDLLNNPYKLNPFRVCSNQYLLSNNNFHIQFKHTNTHIQHKYNTEIRRQYSNKQFENEYNIILSYF